jgi:hypothetical protein
VDLSEAERLKNTDELTGLADVGLAWRSTTVRIKLARPTRHHNSSDELLPNDHNLYTIDHGL